MRASSARATPGSGQGAATAAEALDQGSAGSAPRPRPCQRLGTHSRRSTSKHRDRRSGRGGRAVRPRESYVRTRRRFIGRRGRRPHGPPRSTGAECQQPGVVVEIRWWSASRRRCGFRSRRPGRATHPRPGARLVRLGRVRAELPVDLPQPRCVDRAQPGPRPRTASTTPATAYTAATPAHGRCRHTRAGRTVIP